LAPLAALAVGVMQKRTAGGQGLALLVAFPVLVAAPQALVALGPGGAAGGTDADLTARIVPATAWVLAAASLVAYLGAVAWMQVRAERQADGTAATMRQLYQDPVPSRWRRRLRVYRGLWATAIFFPAALLAAVDLSPSFTASLAASFGAQAARAQ